jgi:toxin ParE1/3/4
MKPEVIKPLADKDLVHAVAFYEIEKASLGTRFLQEFRTLVISIRQNPGIGSQRYGHLIPGMRIRHIARFPFLVLYLERESAIEVIRVLHIRRDLPAALEEMAPDS